MKESKRMLENWIGEEISAYCYPNGTSKDYSDFVMKTCSETGYKTGFTTLSRGCRITSYNVCYTKLLRMFS